MKDISNGTLQPCIVPSVEEERESLVQPPEKRILLSMSLFPLLIPFSSSLPPQVGCTGSKFMKSLKEGERQEGKPSSTCFHLGRKKRSRRIFPYVSSRMDTSSFSRHEKGW